MKELLDRILMAEKIKRMRNCARIMLGEEYQERVGEYKAIILAKMKKEATTILEATISLGVELQELAGNERGAETAIIYSFAACADLIEEE